MKAKDKKLKVYTLDQIKNEMIGKPGSEERKSYEAEVEAAIKKGLADVKAGRVTPHKKARKLCEKWL